MRPTHRLLLAPGALDLIEDAVASLRRAPAAVHATYLAATVPFVLAFLFFWADMSRSPFAGRHLGAASLAVAVLFLWMKVGQVLFCRRLWSAIVGRPAPALSLGSAVRIGLVQAATQPLALIALSFSAIAMLPFGWAVAYGQSLTALAAGDDHDPRHLAARAREQAALWPAQNHVLLGFLSIFAAVVALNLALVLLLGPYLVKMMLGVESNFTRAGVAAFNTTFLAAVGGCTFISCDPVLKAVYLLRCFHGQSIHTGSDLRAGLHLDRPSSPGGSRRWLAATLLAVLSAPATAAPLSAPATAAPFTPPATRVTIEALDASIRAVLERPEYAWRLPRSAPKEEPNGVIASALHMMREGLRAAWRAIVRAVVAFVRWLEDLLPDPQDLSPQTGSWRLDWAFAAQFLAYVLLALVAVLLAVLLSKARIRRARPIAGAAAARNDAPPDVASEETTAADLPEDRWLDLARELMARGELRLAARALFLAALAHLAALELVQIARHKSNREYARELTRRTAERSELHSGFAATVALFERGWYGDHVVDAAVLASLESGLDRIRSLA